MRRRAVISKQYSIAETREKLAHIIQEAEEGATVQLTRRGRPVAVLLSLDEYNRLSRKNPSFWAAYEEFRRKYESQDIESADVFSDVRDNSPGRDFCW